MKAPEKKSYDAALLSISFLMDALDRAPWRNGGGRGPWEACLAALVLAYDPACKPRRLLEAVPAAKGMDRTGFLNAMANLGYFSSSMTLPMRDVETRLLPCLFVPAGEEGAPVVILARNGEELTVYDSASHAVKTMTHREARGAGDAVFFLPYDRHRQQTSKFMREGTGRSWFGAVVRRFNGTFAQILVTCLVLNIFALAPALFVMAVYDRVISPSDLSALPALMIGVSVALVAEYLLRGVRSEGLAWMTARLDNVVGARIFSHLIGLAPELIERASVAAQVARIRTFEAVRDFFSSAVFLSFLEIPFVLIAAAVMWVVAGPLVLVPLGMIALYAALFFYVRGHVRNAIRLAAKASSARQQFSIETFEKLRSVRMNGLTAAWGRRFEDLSGREVLMNFHLGFLGTVAETVANGLTIIAAVLTIGCGAHLVWAGAMTTGALVASMILVWRILLPFYSLCTMIPRLEQLRNSIAQVNSLMDLDTEADKAQGAAVLPQIRGLISLGNVSLRYEGTQDPVFSGLTLHLKAGAVAAVTGRNGSGKTSLLKIIKGLYLPQEGALRIDGFDVRQLDPVELRRQIAYVPQKPEFIPGTVAENVAIGNPLATAEDIERALRRADAWDEVQRLPEGLETRIGRGALGVNLSARIALARAYLQNAPVILIDELPNAVMNGQAGRNLKQYIEQCRGQKTVIMVTYRGDMLGMADAIVHLARGEAPKAGARDIMLKFLKEAA